MKVGLLIYGSLDTVSGGYYYNRQLCAHLREQGDQVQLISWPWRGYWWHLTDNLRRRYSAEMRSLHVDILIQDEMNHPSVLLLNRQLRKAVDYKIVSLVHLLKVTDPSHSQLGKWVQFQIERQYLAEVDGLICTSETTKDEIERRFGLQKPTVVAYPGGDRFADFSHSEIERAVGNRPMRLLYVGNVIERKGLHRVLDAMAALEGVVLSVVGSLSAEPAYTKAILRQIDRLHLRERVSFLGSLARAQLADQYAQSDLFVMPSSYESFGIVFLEALQSGLPVVAARAGAAAELIDHGSNGLLVPLDDRQALAASIALMRDNPQLRRKMGRRARISAETHPSWHTSMSKVRSFLENLI